jgi:peroxiredoxin
MIPGQALSASPVLGTLAPDFELVNLSGDLVRLSDYKGTPVLINFWATWCGPCKLEMPSIQERYKTLAPRFEVLAVNFDEPVERVEGFVDEVGVSFPVLLDPGAKIQELYRVRGYPTTYLVDANGYIQVHHVGFMSEAQLDRYLEQAGVEG